MSNLPIYYMSLFKMPKVVIERLDRIRRDFLWEGHGEKKKLHLMKWSEVIKPKSKGGLGLGSLEIKIGRCWLNGGGGLGRKRRLFGGG